MSKRTTAADILARKRAAWVARTGLVLSLGQLEVIALLSQKRRQGVRVNPLVADAAETLAQLTALGWRGRLYAGMAQCYSIDAGLDAVRDSALAASGAVFIQNAASWLPVVALDPQPDERILDVCAAPGGKTSHIAALTGNQARIWANDNSRPRLLKMQANLRRLSVQAEDITLFDATRIARQLAGQQFDKILLDAPCSGEGLMHYARDKDFASWSVAHIKRLQQLQKHLIIQAWELLRPGGRLVYSTCTMAPEENEAVVDYLLRVRDTAALMPLHSPLPNHVPPVTSWNGRPYQPAVQGCVRLTPTPEAEAFFVAAFVKQPAAGA